MREISLRALLAPIMMLIFRTVLLVYFVSPTRKPLFGLLVGAWIVYEAWGPLRAALNGAAQREAAQAGPAPARQGQEGGAGAAGNAQGQNGAAAQPGALAQDGAVGAANRPGVRHAAYAGTVLDSLANINIPTEAQVLAASERTPPPPPPRLAHKITTFVALLLLTLHPAVWDRRRVAVRQREGHLRTETNARERQPEAPTAEAVEGEGTAQRSEQERMAAVRADLTAVHARRPRWVQDYVERARSGEWVDD
ncbi:hypothetical protein FIBSPDRAFT_415678 [Athelia psychrophila]|uniref:Uncharacterized protein n=1 Tax=Athelia psychrophila TaxID=1759441 RepID=A0A166N0Z6_9AGAM|nr:hypothetical protein FIBSPDRAFT_415678 [Fibularhizoctonia sp. CBS 109695]